MVAPLERRSSGVTMSYGASGWDTPVLSGTASVRNLKAGGKALTAVYLPFGNSATAGLSAAYLESLRVRTSLPSTQS